MGRAGEEAICRGSAAYGAGSAPLFCCSGAAAAHRRTAAITATLQAVSFLVKALNAGLGNAACSGQGPTLLCVPPLHLTRCVLAPFAGSSRLRQAGPSRTGAERRVLAQRSWSCPQPPRASTPPAGLSR